MLKTIFIWHLASTAEILLFRFNMKCLNVAVTAEMLRLCWICLNLSAVFLENADIIIAYKWSMGSQKKSVNMLIICWHMTDFKLNIGWTCLLIRGGSHEEIIKIFIDLGGPEKFIYFSSLFHCLLCCWFLIMYLITWSGQRLIVNVSLVVGSGSKYYLIHIFCLLSRLR